MTSETIMSKLSKDTQAGDVLVLSNEPLEPGWIHGPTGWWKFADWRDADRWVETRPSPLNGVNQ